MERFKVIRWQRGSYSIADTRYEIGDPRRRDGKGYRSLREAERAARRKNEEAQEGEEVST